MGKGSRAERELVNIFWDSGFAVMRSPASGSGRKHPQPDVLVSDGENIFGIETKSTSSDVVYVSKDEIRELKKFCRKFGCEPIIGVRFDWKGWVFFRPNKCEQTENSYKISKDMVGWELIEGEGFCKQETL